MVRNESVAKNRKADLAEALSKMNRSDIEVKLTEIIESRMFWRPLMMMSGYVQTFADALSGVSCPWIEMFKPTGSSDLLDANFPLSHMDPHVYEIALNWLNRVFFPNEVLRDFVLWAIGCIFDDMEASPHKENPKSCGIFVTLAMVMRYDPDAVCTRILPVLRSSYYKRRPYTVPITVWLTAQITSQERNVPWALFSWAHNLLPVLSSNPHLILDLVAKILSQPEGTLMKPVGSSKDQVIPPSSFEILLRLSFPASSARVPTTERFEIIYPLLKIVALTDEAPHTVGAIFTISLRLAGEGFSTRNSRLTNEALDIALGYLLTTDNNYCWTQWLINLYNTNLKASGALLTKLVDKCTTTSGAPGNKTRQLFSFSLMLAADGNDLLPWKAIIIVIRSLVQIADYCQPWYNLYTENLQDCVLVLTNLVEKWKVHYLVKPVTTNAMKVASRHIFTFSLKLAQQGNAKEAASIACWFLTKNIYCCKVWNKLYDECLEASVALLDNLIDECKFHYPWKLLSTDDILTLSQTIQSFRLKNKNGIAAGGDNASLYKQADRSCKVISNRLTFASLNVTFIMVIILLLVLALLSSNLEVKTNLKNLVDQLSKNLVVQFS